MHFILEVFYDFIHFKKREGKFADFQIMEIKPMANFLIHYSYYLYYISTYYNVGIPTEMNISLR